MDWTSNITELDAIFGAHPEHVNREYVYPAKVNSTPVYIDPEIQADEKAMQVIKSLLVTIITPHSIDAVKESVKQDSINILQSCFENGRVLQSPIKIVIWGVEYTVVAKWVWATEFYRKTGAITPFMHLENFQMSQKEIDILKVFPFYEHGWSYRMEYALQELERSKLIQSMWIDVEKVLAIFEIDSVMGKDGKYVSIEQLEKDGVITSGLRPVILIRAHQSNFRLLDPIVLDTRKRNESIAPLIQHILLEAEKHWETKNMDEYLQKLVQTILSNRLKLIWKFETLNWDFWQDVFRNFSIFGEELDLWDMKPMKGDFYHENPHDYVDHYKSKIKTLFTWFRKLIEVIEKNTDYTINHEEFANIIYSTIIWWIWENQKELKHLYETHDWQRWEKSFNGFLRWLIKAWFISFLNYTPEHQYEKILKERVEKVLWYA